MNVITLVRYVVMCAVCLQFAMAGATLKDQQAHLYDH